jgi:hypothetical protein
MTPLLGSLRPVDARTDAAGERVGDVLEPLFARHAGHGRINFPASADLVRSAAGTGLGIFGQFQVLQMAERMADFRLGIPKRQRRRGTVTVHIGLPRPWKMTPAGLGLIDERAPRIFLGPASLERGHGSSSFRPILGFSPRFPRHRPAIARTGHPDWESGLGIRRLAFRFRDGHVHCVAANQSRGSVPVVQSRGSVPWSSPNWSSPMAQPALRAGRCFAKSDFIVISTGGSTGRVRA